jgi:hypothetical protein
MKRTILVSALVSALVACIVSCLCVWALGKFKINTPPGLDPSTWTKLTTNTPPGLDSFTWSKPTINTPRGLDPSTWIPLGDSFGFVVMHTENTAQEVTNYAQTLSGYFMIRRADGWYRLEEERQVRFLPLR